MHHLCSIDKIVAVERAAAADLPVATLMQRAGLEAAKVALNYLALPLTQAKVLVSVGPGNNGGDALEVAYQLAQRGAQVTLLPYPGINESPEFVLAMARARQSAVHFMAMDNIQDVISLITSITWDLIIDGLFGIGLTRPITGDLKVLIHAINALSVPILALDVPSGLDADTGNIVGIEQGGVAVRATATITFIADKIGLHTLYGRDCAGKVYVADLETGDLYINQLASRIFLNSVDLFQSSLQQRLHHTNKGTYGNVAIVGGAPGMVGAVLLAGRAALHSGAGRVFVVSLDETLTYDGNEPELMCRSPDTFDFSSAALVVGPGLGLSSEAHALLARVLEFDTPMLLDADALNLIAQDQGLQQKVAQRISPTLMTPHPLEAARLLGCSLQEVQSDRLRSARTLSDQYQAYLILKGTGTVIASPNSDVVINSTGNPGLATAGTGDVLAGVGGALLAQRWPARDAALAAVWLHGKAADVLVEQGVGPIGLTASELILPVRTLLNSLTSEVDGITSHLCS